ncbi:MAG: S49 family peptidase [Phycisphaerales bacterium]|jgi:protease-4|nr:S49 family peptidase [Phycisphaeraceae bacterium]
MTRCTPTALLSARTMIAGLALVAGSALSALASNTVALIELDGPISDRGRDTGGLALFGGGGDKLHMRDLLKAFETAAKDNDVEGIIIRVLDAELTPTMIQELGDGIKRARDAGKKVHLFAENLSTNELLLGARCDEIIIQTGGGVMLPGVYMEEMFLADTLRWAGIEPSFVQVGDYKGASEMMANSKPSPQWDENINKLLDQMYGQVRSELKAGRKLSDAQLDKAMETAWLASDTDAKAVGLVDTITDWADIDAHLAKTYGDDMDWRDDLLPSSEIDLANANPFTVFAMLMKKPEVEPKRDTIAVVHIDGAIVDGESAPAGIMGGGGNVGSRTIRRTLMDLEDNENVKGVVLRIDSPGGSAIASEIILQGVKRLSKVKPVFVSVGSMAASGGYYIAVAGQRIYMNESSIVGSIGVVGGKMSLGGLMEKLKVNIVPRARGPRASMFGAMSPWSDAEKAIVRQKMTETYDLFTKRVTEGRPGIDLSKAAEGRLFCGPAALDLKMVDEIGSLNDAVTELASTLNLTPGQFDVFDFPPPPSFEEMLSNAFGGASASLSMNSGNPLMAQVSTTARALLGDQTFDTVRSGVEAMLQLRNEPVILATPRALLFRW